MSESTRGRQCVRVRDARRVVVLLSLLFGAGCFQPDEKLEQDAYPVWNPQAPQPDAALQPVLGGDAAPGWPPPMVQDAAGAPPALDAGRDPLPPGLAPADADLPPRSDAAADDADATDDTAPAVDAGPPMMPPGPPPTTLSFSVLTKSLGGRYAPRNIGAIWIENASGQWVKTLAVWAFLRERHLTRFRAASGGNRVDAITSATLSQHTTHEVTWDLTDATGVPVPDGDYRVVVETTDRDATGDSCDVAFTKGPLPARSTPPDTAHYVNMSLALE